MRRLMVTKLVVVGTLLGLGCGSDERAAPTGPSAAVTVAEAQTVIQMGKLIAALFPRPRLLAEAELRLAAIVLAKAQGKLPLAQKLTFGLVDYALQKYAKHELKGDQSAATKANLDALLNLAFPYVGLPAPGPLTRALAPGAAAVVITPTSPPTDVTTGDKQAGVRVPTGAISTTQTVLVTVTPTLNQTHPLPTALTQYGPFYDFQTFPAVPTFNAPVTIGVCVDLTDVPLAVQQRLQLAYPAPGSTAVTIGPRAPTPFLDCPPLALASVGAGRSWLRTLLGWATGLVRPTPLYAQASAEGGAGTQTNTFGDVCPEGGAGTQSGTFCAGAVDPSSELQFTVQPSPVPTGSIMAPAVVVRVQTPFGQLITTFQGSVQLRLLDGATGLAGTVIQPVIGGVATFADLTIATPGTGRRLEAIATSTTAGAPRAVNSSTFDVTGGAPDLIIASLTFTPTPRTTRTLVTITAVVQNIGTSAAGPSSLQFAPYDDSPVNLSVPALAGGQTFTVQQQTVVVPSHGVDNPAYLPMNLYADFTDAVAEASEANNHWHDTLFVDGDPEPLSGTTGGVAPLVDGVLTSGEWDAARCQGFNANIPGGGVTPAFLCVMNDASMLYAVVRYHRPSNDGGSQVALHFDSDGIGGYDDAITLETGGAFSDVFANSSGVNFDVADGGTSDGTGVPQSNALYRVFELSHPLNSADDAHDFSLTAPIDILMFLAVRTIPSGGGGTTETFVPAPFGTFMPLRIVGPF